MIIPNTKLATKEPYKKQTKMQLFYVVSNEKHSKRIVLLVLYLQFLLQLGNETEKNKT